jgi:hypothetical protein
MTGFIKDAAIKSLVAEKDVERLIEVLERGGTRAMQMEAATALGEHRDTRAIPALSKMGEDDKWHWIGARINSITSLGMIRCEDARDALDALIEYDDFHQISEDVKAIQEAAKRVA